MKNKDEFEVGKTLKAYHPPSREEPKLKVTSEQKQPRRLRRGLAIFGLVIIAVAIFISVWDAINISRAAGKTFGSGNVFSLLSPSSVKQQDGRTNLLLVGYSIDDPGHPGASLTDSIVLLSLSTKGHASYMLSIPRDLYVNIPGFGYGKINETYKDGSMGLLERVVSDDFGVSVDYTALFNYAAVRDMVNALGGITVNIKSPDPRGLFDPNIGAPDGGPLKLSNGIQKLDGQTALNLTRARGDAYNSYGFPQSDFDRTEHQRQVILAIQAKLDWKLILNPLKNGKVLSSAGHNIKTDIDIHQVRPLFSLVNRVGTTNLKSYSLRDLAGKNYLSSYSSYYSGSALIPSAGIDNYSQIKAAIAQIDQ